MRQLGEEARRFEAALESERASRAAEVLHAYECQKREANVFGAGRVVPRTPSLAIQSKLPIHESTLGFSGCCRYLQPDVSAGATPEEINPGSSETL